MSTGDQSIYLRGRMAERRGKPDYGGPGGQWSSPPQFMKDGYVKWAESTRPAREGGSEKIPSEKQMPRKDAYRGKGIIEDFIPLAPTPLKEMGEFYLKAKEYTPKIKGVLRDKDIQKSILNGKYADKMEQIAKYMEMVGLGHMKHDADMVRRVGGSKSYKAHCEEEGSRSPSPTGGRIGMGRKGESMEETVERCLKGGMSMEQTLEALKKKGKAVYDWLKANKSLTKAVMTSKFLNEDLGTDIPRKVKGYMEKVGLGVEEDHKRIAAEMSQRHTEMMRKLPKAPAPAKKAPRFNPQSFKFEDDLEGQGLYSDAKDAHSAYKLAKKFTGGRQPSQYALFVKDFAKKHPGPDLMKRAGAAWRSR